MGGWHGLKASEDAKQSELNWTEKKKKFSMGVVICDGKPILSKVNCDHSIGSSFFSITFWLKLLAVL